MTFISASGKAIQRLEADLLAGDPRNISALAFEFDRAIPYQRMAKVKLSAYALSGG